MKAIRIAFIPKKSSQFLYGIFLNVAIYTTASAFVLLIIGALGKDIVNLILPNIKNSVKVVVLSDNPELLSGVLSKFDSVAYKVKYKIAKNQDEFAQLTQTSDVGIISGKSNLKILDEKNIFIPFDKTMDVYGSQNVLKSLNKIDRTWLSVCYIDVSRKKLMNVHNDMDLNNQDIIDHSIVIGQTSYAGNNLPLMAVATFLSEYCYNNK